MTTGRNTRGLTRVLVKDYVCYRLRKSGYEDREQQFGGGQLTISSSPSPKLTRTLHLMSDEFTNAYFTAFDEMTNPINVYDDNLKEVVYKILDVTCDTGVEWGRIVGIFVFTGLLAVKAMDCEQVVVVENLIKWTADYLESDKYTNWINQQGGWDGFLQFYNNPTVRQQDLQQQFWVQAYTVGANVFTKVAAVANLLLH